MRVFTSHWRNSELGEVDAVMVSISRGRPRWKLPFRYRRLDVLAPGDEAWSEKDRVRFEAAYVRQLEELGAERIMADLKRIADYHASVLLCWERLAVPDEYCHRLTLSRFLEREAGITVPELQAGMLPKRPGTPQPALFDYREARA